MCTAAIELLCVRTGISVSNDNNITNIACNHHIIMVMIINTEERHILIKKVKHEILI